MPGIQALLNAAADKLAASSDSATLDAEVLLSFILNKPRSHLRAWPDKIPETSEIEQFLQLIQQRQQGLPIAYLTGHKEFWSRDFQVSTAVLIPRPDTELLIEISLDLISKQAINHIIDLGTGSGIIGITLAAECPHTRITATDASPAALNIAKQNAKNHQIKNIEFMHSDWFNNIPNRKFQLIVSNPPYIADDDVHLQQGDVRFEPKTALIAAQQGLSDIRLIAEQARRYLADTGHLLIEHGYQQQQPVQDIFKQLGYAAVKTYPDLSGNPRVTYGQWSSTSV